MTTVLSHQDALSALLRTHEYDELSPTFVEPGTLLALGSLAISIMGYFKKISPEKAREIQEILEWVPTVRQDLAHFQESLGEIQKTLKSLRVFVDESFAEHEGRTVLGWCSVYMSNASALTTANDPGDLKAALRGLYFDLQSSTAALRLHGYTQIHTVMYAMKVECDLASILKLGNVREIAAVYGSYFRAALDRAIPNSISGRLAAYRAEMARLAGQTPGKDQVIDMPFYYTDNHKRRCSGGGRGEGRECVTTFDSWRAHFGLRVNGDISSGYNVTSGDVMIGADPSQPASTYHRGQDAARAAANVYIQTKYGPVYQRLCIDYADARDSAQMLEKCEESLAGFVQVADAVAAGTMG
jgi:hypothetical protein